MFNEIVSKSGEFPKKINTDRDPAFNFHRWKANLRMREIEEIKTVPEVPWSNAFVERAIGSCRRECVDRVLFWNENDLKRKLENYRRYYNESLAHYSLGGSTPSDFRGEIKKETIDPANYRFKKCGNGIFSTPIAA